MTFINHINLQKPSKTTLIPGVLNHPVPVGPSIPCHTVKSVSRPASAWSLVSSALLDVWSPIPPIPSEHKYYSRNVYALVVRSYRTPSFMNGGHPIILISVISQSEGITKELGRKIQGKQRWSPVVPGEIGQAMLYSTFKGGGGGYDQMQGQAFMPGKRRGGGVGWRVQRCSKSLSWLKIIETPNGSKWLPWDKRT